MANPKLLHFKANNKLSIWSTINANHLGESAGVRNGRTALWAVSRTVFQPFEKLSFNHFYSKLSLIAVQYRCCNWLRRSSRIASFAMREKTSLDFFIGKWSLSWSYRVRFRPVPSKGSIKRRLTSSDALADSPPLETVGAGLINLRLIYHSKKFSLLYLIKVLSKRLHSYET